MNSFLRAGVSQPITRPIHRTQPFHLEGCVVSDAGRIRATNEDNFVLDGRLNPDAVSFPRMKAEMNNRTQQSSWHLAGVFDGIGGGEKGEQAAHAAAEIFSQAFLEIGAPIPKEEMDLLMRHCFLTANNRIVRLKREYRSYGTTGTVLCTNGMEFKVYHLGDSRAYLFREGELFQLTKDQTLAQMKHDAASFGVYAPSFEAASHILTEYIGRDHTMGCLRPMESQWISFLPGDRLLLCSDGLYDMCDEGQITDILEHTVCPAEAAEKLTKTAICNGGADNITCLVMAQTI